MVTEEEWAALVERVTKERNFTHEKLLAECAENDRLRRDNEFLAIQVDLCQRRLCKEGGSR